MPFQKLNQGLSPDPLRCVICGTAGTGKSYLIGCFRSLLRGACCVAAPTATGVAAFNVNGRTLHSLLKLPLNFTASNELRGPALQNLQEQLKQCRYLIIDEMSMIGRRQLGMIHQRLCQARPDHAGAFRWSVLGTGRRIWTDASSGRHSTLCRRFEGYFVEFG